MSDLVCVKSFNTRTEAEIARGLVETSGILATITGDDAGGSYPFPIQLSPTGMKLLVKKEDETKAHELLGN